MADQFSTFASMIPQAIEESYYDGVLPTDDGIWSITQAFKANYQYGRDPYHSITSATNGWFHTWRILQQKAGTVQGSTFQSPTIETAGLDTTFPLNEGTANDVYAPDPTYVPNRTYFLLTMQLAALTGNLTATRALVEAATISGNADVASMSSDLVDDLAEKLRHTFCVQAYCDGSGVWARVKTAASVTTTGTIVYLSEGTAQRFIVGDAYVLAAHVAPANYGSSRRTKVLDANSVGNVMICVDHDLENNAVYFQSPAGRGQGTLTLTAGQDIMPEEMYDFNQATVNAGSRAMEGLESLLITSGTFPGPEAHNVANRRYLRSHVYGAEGEKNLPSGSMLSAPFMAIKKARQAPPTILLCEEGVYVKFQEIERSSFMTYSVPTAGPFAANGGIGNAPMFTWGTSSASWVSSDLIRPNCVIGVTPSTFSRAMPPRAMAINWVYNTGGGPGVPGPFGPPIMEGKRVGTLMQAPFFTWGQWGCTDPQANFRYLGVVSSSDVA